MKALKAQDVSDALRHSRGARVDEDVAPKFKAGEPVLTRNFHPVGHTRLPRYARARHGTISCDYGVFIFPDAHGMGKGKKPQHLYSVCFTARQLSGASASAHVGIYLDMWDDYLDPA